MIRETLVLLAVVSPLLNGAASAGVSVECRSPLRACVGKKPFGMSLENLQRNFAQVVAVADADYDPAQCDVGLRIPSGWSWNTEIYSVRTKKLLGRVNGESATQMSNNLCQALVPGGAFAAEFGLASPSVAPAVASAGGVSREEMAQMIAAAVKGAPPSAPTASFPAAQSAASPIAPPAAPELPASPAPRYSAAGRADDLAVIVGIEGYSDIATKAPYAERDADAFKAHVRALGVPERNIVLLTGSKAVRSALTKNIEGWLPRMVKPGSRVYFYFSGHGAPDVKSGQAYLVPWDGDPNFLDATAYPVARLYQKLAALPARQVLVALDSCFSGAGGRSVLATGARPLVVKVNTGTLPGKLTVLAASAANEISGSLDAQGHGAFTYFLLEALNAGKTTPRALNEYLTPRVQDEARRLNRDQTPQLQGGGDWSLR